jgi:hypothetical protein
MRLQQAPGSLETVIGHLISSAEERARKAREFADAKNINDSTKCDDLEEEQVHKIKGTIYSLLAPFYPCFFPFMLGALPSCCVIESTF